MAKKGFWAKALVGLTATAVAGKVAYDKYKVIKEKFEEEENESLYEEVKKYNAVCTSKNVEIDEEEFTGCEIKAIASKLVLDLSLAVFEKDVYINFKSDASSVKIILPEGVNATCDIENLAGCINNNVENVLEDGIHTVYIIGKSTLSCIDVVSAEFYIDEEDEFEDDFEEESEENTEVTLEEVTE